MYSSCIIRGDWNGERPNYEERSWGFETHLSEIFGKMVRQGLLEPTEDDDEYSRTIEARTFYSYREACGG